MQSKEISQLVDSNDGTERLASYVYEYLVHIGAPQTAKTFLQEINWKKDIALGDPPGFLYAWWSVFWDLYSAAPERRDAYSSSSEAKAYHDYGFANSNYLLRSNNTEAPNFRSPKPPNTPSIFDTKSFPRSSLPSAVGPPFRSLSFSSVYPFNSRREIRPQGEFNMHQHMLPNMPNPPSHYNKAPPSMIRQVSPPKSFADLGKYHGGNSRFPPLHPPVSSHPNLSYSGITHGGNHQLTQGNRESSSGYNFPSKNYMSIPKHQRPTGQSKLPDFATCNQDFAFSNQRPINGPQWSDYKPNYRPSSPVPQKPKEENGTKRLKGCSLSESDSSKDDYAEFSDFNLTDYRRFLEGDNDETVAIMKIKESMQEEAKKFEKASEPPNSYTQLP